MTSKESSDSISRGPFPVLFIRLMDALDPERAPIEASNLFDGFKALVGGLIGNPSKMTDEQRLLLGTIYQSLQGKDLVMLTEGARVAISEATRLLKTPNPDEVLVDEACLAVRMGLATPNGRTTRPPDGLLSLEARLLEELGADAVNRSPRYLREKYWMQVSVGIGTISLSRSPTHFPTHFQARLMSTDVKLPIHTFTSEDRVFEWVVQMAKRHASAEASGPDLVDSAWGLIANAYGGDWDLATPEWREAAEDWRCQMYKHLHENRTLNDLELLQERLCREFPGLETCLKGPKDRYDTSYWTLDVCPGGTIFVSWLHHDGDPWDIHVSWAPEFSLENGIQSEAFTNADSAFDHIVALIRNRNRTMPLVIQQEEVLFHLAEGEFLTLEAMVDKTLVSLDFDKGNGHDDADFVSVLTDDGSKYLISHYGDEVRAAAIVGWDGHPDDVLGTPLLSVERRVVVDERGPNTPYDTNTIYRFVTVRGAFLISWSSTSDNVHLTSLAQRLDRAEALKPAR